MQTPLCGYSDPTHNVVGARAACNPYTLPRSWFHVVSPVEWRSDFNSFPYSVSYVVQVLSPFPWCADRFRVSIQCVVRSPSLVSCCVVDFGFPCNGNIARSPSLISTQRIAVDRSSFHYARFTGRLLHTLGVGMAHSAALSQV